MISFGSTEPATFIVKRNKDKYSYIGTPSAFLGYKSEISAASIEDGIWAEWSWHQDQIQLRNDRYGMFPLYIYYSSDTFAVSTHIIDLLKHAGSLELDDAAISVFLRIGFFIGEDTPFLHIKAIPPGSEITWKKGDFTISSTGSHYSSDSSHLSRQDALHAYGELFQAAVERYLSIEENKILLPLSGGRDTRHILFALIQNQRKPNYCITVNTGSALYPSADVDIAALIAEKLQIQHHILEIPSNLLKAELQKNILTSFCSDEHIWILALREYLLENEFDILVDGIGGDVLSAGLFLNPRRMSLLVSGQIRQLAYDILGLEDHLPRMLAPAFQKRWNRDLAIQHLLPELSKHIDSPNPIGQFFFWNRTRREIALSPWSILKGPCHVIAPYLSTEVYDFLSALPVHYFSDHTFHTDAINIHHPEYSHLPYAKIRNPHPKTRLTTRVRFVFNLARHIFPITDCNYPINFWSFLVPRLVKGIISQEYGSRLHINYQMPIYLTQLHNTVVDFN